MALPSSRTNPDLVAARFLLKPGRKYEHETAAGAWQRAAGDRDLGFEYLVFWVNVAKLPRLFPDDPGAVELPVDLPTQAPA